MGRIWKWVKEAGRRCAEMEGGRERLSVEVLEGMEREALIAEVMRLQKAVDAKDGREVRNTSARNVGAKQKRQVDFSKRRLIALKIAYVGWMFDGFALQPTKTNTVEAQLIQALKRTQLIDDTTLAELLWTRGGRTDVGVSSVGNVVGVRVRCLSDGADYAKIINGVLPDGLRILAWASPAEPGVAINNRRTIKENQPFDARNDAVSRTYKYFFLRERGQDIEAMREAAKHFIGRHDFRNFCKVDVKGKVENFERVMLDVRIVAVDAENGPNPAAQEASVGGLYAVVIDGYAFLWHQVRCMVSILFKVGRSQESPDIVRKMLQVGPDSAFADGKPTYRMASELPLVLYACHYPTELVDFASYRADAVMVQRRLQEPLSDVWLRSRMKAAVADCFLSEVNSIRLTGSERRTDSDRTMLRSGILDADQTVMPLEKRQREGSVEEKLETRRRKQLKKLALAQKSEG